MNPPRIAILGLHLEANSFAPPTVLEDFEKQCLARGDGIAALARAPASPLPAELPGFFREMDASGAWVPVPVLMAAAPPGGPIAQEVFEGFLAEMRAGLAAALPLDGVYICSHGAASATGDEDPDGTVAAAVREIAGREAVVVCTHDLHCNVSQRLVDSVDALVIYRTNPHVDMAERAAEAARLLREGLAGERFARALVRLPMTPPTVTMLTVAPGPYRELVEAADAAMRGTPGLANLSLAGGFPHTDLPKNGLCVVANARGGDAALAQRAALALARQAWENRERFRRPTLDVAQAVAVAREAGDGAAPPVCFADAGDNPGGGGRGNTTWLLRGLHEARVPGVVLGNFVDPALAAEAHALGEGAAFDAVLNRTEDLYGKRLEARARVLQLSDGEAVGRRGTVGGRAFSLGPSALIELAESGMRVVVCSLRRQLLDPVMLEMFGVDIAAARVVVCKSRGHFRAGFDEFFPPERIMEVDAPGLTSPTLSAFEFRRLPRPVWPLDADVEWNG